MRRVFIMWIAVLALAAPLAPGGSPSSSSFEFSLAKKKQNFGPTTYNCKNRRTYADHRKCGFI